MKKTSTVVKEKKNYEIFKVINNTAYIKSVTGKTGLLDIKKHQVIGEMDDFYTIIDSSNEFYLQKKESNLYPKTTLRIYDALNEVMIADSWELVESFEFGGVVAVKSPIDNKIHIFDHCAYRKNPTNNIFNMALDDVRKFNVGYYETDYLMITVNDKKGLYSYKKSDMIIPVEFDDIEQLPNIIVYTKDNKKYFEYIENFVYTEKYNEKSDGFDSITRDKNNGDIIYCKKGTETYVYNTCLKKLLFKNDFDEITCVSMNSSGIYTNKSYDYYRGEFFFQMKNNDKFGLMSSIAESHIGSNDVQVKNSFLLEPIYDEIKKDIDSGAFYVKNNSKKGLFIGDSNHNQVIKPKYDDIAYLGCNHFALYTNEFCDIGKIDPNTPLLLNITKCKIQNNVDCGLIYKQGEQFGILLPNCNHNDVIIPAGYDNINYVENNYFVLEQGSKKGVMENGKIIIPLKYEDIKFGRHLLNNHTMYFALKNDKKYKLAKINYQNEEPNIELVSNYAFEKIDFFHEIMMLQDQTNSYIYNYEEKLLKTLPDNNVFITEYEDGKDYFYSIDDVDYFYNENGVFEVALAEEQDFYITTYETAIDLFEIKTCDKQEHDKFCTIIDSQKNSVAEKFLTEMADDGVERDKYPTLVLKKINKNSN